MEVFLRDEKCEKSRKNRPLGDQTDTEVTGFNGEITATTVKWDQEVAKVTGGTFRVTPISLRRARSVKSWY